MSTTLSIGVDPGKSGAIAFISHPMGDVWCVNADETLHDIADELRTALANHDSSFAVIEKVQSSPQMGVKSAFSFGQSFGSLLGLLAALQVPHELVSPQKWQKAMCCLTGGDKNKTKSRAQQLFPHMKVTHATADALLLAKFCGREFS